MNSKKSKYSWCSLSLKTIKDFWSVWIKDFISYPIRYIENRRLKRQKYEKIRQSIKSDVVKVCIHEWGGYDLSRKKHIKSIKPFECGIKAQLLRFNSGNNPRVDITVTMSDSHLSRELDWIKSRCNHFISVENTSMDFSGYGTFYEKIKNEGNSYIILTNSSVNNMQSSFLENYVSYMDSHPNVGLMGISASSKYYHTLIRNNFNPHIQSFFILTTISVLNEIVEYNGGKFPGKNCTNKHLLIRLGEVELSRIALKLGYNLAVVYKNQVTEFNYSAYPLPLGDLRIYNDNPNSISTIL